MDTTIAPSSNGRASVASRSIGVSGLVEFGGIIYHDEYDRAWKGDKRDDTIRHMLDDPLIGAVLHGIEMLVRRVDWRVEPADDSPAAEDVATFVQECLDDMRGYWPGDTLAAALTFLGWGWSCLEVVYKRRLGIGTTAASRYDDGKIGWERWALRPQPTRYGWEFDGDDAAVLIQQDPETYRLYRIPLDKCIVFRYASRDNSPEGSTPLRVAYDAWYNKRKAQRLALIGIERDLAGLPVGRVSASDIAANTPVYQAMQGIVTNIRVDAQGGLVLASDRDESGHYLQDVTLLSTGGTKSIDPLPYIQHFANELVMVYMANVMRAGQDGVGTYALAETQGGLFQQAIGAHLDTVAMTITEQAILPLCRLNGIDDELAPTLDHGNIESADLDEMGRWLTVMSAIGGIVMTPELKFFLGEIAGLPVPAMDELKAMEATLKAEEKKRQDAMAQAQPKSSETSDPNSSGKIADQTVKQSDNGKPVTAGEVKRFVEENGSLTLPDILAIVEWWRDTVPAEFADMLNAEIVGKEG